MKERFIGLINHLIDLINENKNTTVVADIKTDHESIIITVLDDSVLNHLQNLLAKCKFFRLELRNASIIISKFESVPEDEFQYFCNETLVSLTLALADVVIENCNQAMHAHFPSVHSAILTRNDEKLASLLSIKANRSCRIDDFDGMEGFWPLHTAAQIDNTSAIEILYQSGADVDQECEGINQGFVPLHIAIMYQNLNAAELLLKLGASPIIKCQTENYPDYSPLMFACMMEDLEAIDLLLSYFSKSFRDVMSHKKILLLEIEGAKRIVQQLEQKTQIQIYAIFAHFKARAAFRASVFSFARNAFAHRYDLRDEVIAKLMKIIRLIQPQVELECINRADEVAIHWNKLKIVLKTEDENILCLIEKRLKTDGVLSSYIKVQDGFRMTVMYNEKLSAKLDEVLIEVTPVSAPGFSFVMD